MKIFIGIVTVVHLLATMFIGMQFAFYTGDVNRLHVQVLELETTVAQQNELVVQFLEKANEEVKTEDRAPSPEPSKPSKSQKSVPPKMKPIVKTAPKARSPEKKSKKPRRARASRGSSDHGTDQWGWCLDRTRC